MADNKTVIRASSLPSYADCSRRMIANMLFDEIRSMSFDLRSTSNNIGSALGSSTHEAAAYSLNSKIYNNDLGNESKAVDIAIETFKAIQSEEGIVYDDLTPNQGSAELQLVQNVRAYRKNIAPLIEPIEVEIRLQVDIGDDFILSGQFDVKEIDTLRDLKTGAVARANIHQYGAYTILCFAHQKTVNRIIEDYLPRKKNPEPEFYEYSPIIATNASKAILKRIKNEVQNFRENGEPTNFLANPGSMLCGEKYCPAWGTKFCKEHKTLST